MRYELWYHDHTSWVSTGMSSRWRWLAELRAWEHEKRGWFKYIVVPAGESPTKVAKLRAEKVA